MARPLASRSPKLAGFFPCGHRTIFRACGAFANKLMNPFLKSALLFAAICCLTGCETVTELVTTNLPQSQSGRASIRISLREQRAYLFRGKELVSKATISTGREGYATPVGNFRVIRKDEDHRSGIYGDYVDAGGRIVKANVDVRKHRRPRGSRYRGAPMPYFVEFRPGYGLHAGDRPGYPASHGCVRLSYWKARQFYNASKIGTRVTIRR
jgi:lipoprotein-anchoring transpeptidase ErfK/SrfK